MLRAGAMRSSRVACERAGRGPQQQKTFIVWMAGNARVAESAAAAEQDFDAMNQTELRKAAKELGVPQFGVRVAELKAACERAVQEQQQQKTLTAWMAGNARVAVSAAAPPDSNPEHSGAGTKLGAARQALPAARKRIAVKPTWLRSKGRQAKRQQIRATPEAISVLGQTPCY